MKVDARDVLDADATTRRFFSGCVVGYFKRTGANAWDDYKYVPQAGETLEVLPGLKVQLERHGADIRLRRQGRVVRVRWVPTTKERGKVEAMDRRQARAYFIERYLSDFDEKPGMGAAAVIASKLDD